MRIKRGILIGISVLLSGYLLFSGVKDLVNREDTVTVKLELAYDFMDYVPQVNGHKLFGNVHLYLGVDEYFNLYTIQASKGWHDANFNEHGIVLIDGGLEVTGLAKNVSSPELSDEILREYEKINMEPSDFPLGMTTILGVNYVFYSVLKLIACIIVIVLAIICKKKFIDKKD